MFLSQVRHSPRRCDRTDDSWFGHPIARIVRQMWRVGICSLSMAFQNDAWSSSVSVVIHALSRHCLPVGGGTSLSMSSSVFIVRP